MLNNAINNVQGLEGVIVAVRRINAQEVLTVVADPLIDLDYINRDQGTSPNTSRASVKKMGLKPILLGPRCVRYFLSDYEAGKKRLHLQTQDGLSEPPQLAMGKKRATAKGGGPGHKQAGQG
jgi:hypothetical protein